MQSFLDMAQDGTKLNQTAFIKPYCVYCSYLYPHGMGGYKHLGKAWCFYLYLLYHVSNNLLKLLATLITPWIKLLSGYLMYTDCSPLITDSTTSEGKISNTNFQNSKFDDPEEAAVQQNAEQEHS